jgi:CRP/FNR family cyclic AMP-dependent transcriptional regulator
MPNSILTEEVCMAHSGKAVFDAQVFVAKVGVGKTMLAVQKNQNVFAQGDVADTVFYIQKGKVKVTVLSDQGKEAVVGILGPPDSSVVKAA